MPSAAGPNPTSGVGPAALGTEVWEPELVYWVEWLDAPRPLDGRWVNRCAALLARQGPELTRLLKVSSATVRVRRGLDLAVRRLLRQEGVRDGYQARKEQGGRATRKALVGVMRTLAVAWSRVGVGGVAVEARRLFPWAWPRQERAGRRRP